MGGGAALARTLTAVSAAERIRWRHGHHRTFAGVVRRNQMLVRLGERAFVVKGDGDGGPTRAADPPSPAPAGTWRRRYPRCR